jgi:hypothetical protein
MAKAEAASARRKRGSREARADSHRQIDRRGPQSRRKIRAIYALLLDYCL